MKKIHILIEEILAVLAKERRPMNFRQVSKKIGVNDPDHKRKVEKILADLAFKKKIDEVGRGKYKYKNEDIFVVGKVEVIRSGAAFIVLEDQDDVFVPARLLASAFNGDVVKVLITSNPGAGKLEGRVMEVLERKKTTFVGVVQQSKKFAFVVPDDFRFGSDIFVPLNKLGKAQNGQKVIVEITDWPDRSDDSPTGKVLEVLGEPGNRNAEIHAILAEFGLPRGFPQNLEEEAKKIPLEITKAELKKRRDFREVLTFTIDPFDAKDFDDAISYRKLENGNHEIGVHIADVTHYVKPGSLIEAEAVERATSIYLVDRVIPMLPEVLSNQVCSLRPNEDKLVFSAVFEINDEAKVEKEWFGKCIIHSTRRFTYEEAQEVIVTGEGDLAKELGVINRIAQTMRKARIKNGAISFDREEVKFKLDGEDKPKEVVFKRSLEAHKLIEEFMLLANRKVAAKIGMPKGENKPKTFVYRIHDTPSEDRVNELGSFVKTFGHSFGGKNPKDIARSMNKLLKEISGTKEENLISTLAVRSMAKAVYTTENIGHYGLAFDYYSHFTSPIRRYPDMMVHRLLEKYLEGAPSANASDVENLCKHSSEREKLASDAERASIKYMQIRYLEDRVGETFDGIVSGITEWGVYVEIKENKCEGMMRLKEIPGDYYEFYEKDYKIKGRRSGKEIRLGDDIRIKVKSIDLYKKQIDFELVL